MECTVQETTFTLMKESRTGNCAIVNNSTKKLLNWKLRLLLQSMVLMINTIRLKFIMMKLNHLKNLSNLINLFCIQIKVIYSSTRAQKKNHCSMISADYSFINFERYKKNFTIIDRNGDYVRLYVRLSEILRKEINKKVIVSHFSFLFL